MFFSPFKIPSSDNPAKSFWAGRKGLINNILPAAYDIRKVDGEITNAPLRQNAVEFYDGIAPMDNILLRKDGGFLVIYDDRADVEYYDDLGSYDVRRTINDGSGGGGVLDWCLALDTNENVYSVGGGGAQNAFHNNGLNGNRQTISISNNYDPLTIDYLSNGNLACLGIAIGPGDFIVFTMDISGAVQSVGNINSGSVPSGGYLLDASLNNIYVRSGNAFNGNQKLISYDYNLTQINQLTGLPTIYHMTTNNLDQLIAIEGGQLTNTQTLVVRDSDLVLLASQVIQPSGPELVQHLGCDQFGNIYITSYIPTPEQSIVRIYDQNLTLKDTITWTDLKIIGTASDFLPVGVKTWN